MTDTANPKILIGASIPRSGHHFLASMMTGYFGRELYYCETYTPADCCKQVPCMRRGKFKYIYQKSHDRDFKLPPGLSNALYLIQYRHPVAEALSDRELDLKDALGRPSLNYRKTRAGYLSWLAGKAIYYRKFHDKWMANRLSNALYLDYGELAVQPDEMMRTIIARAGASLNASRLGEVVEQSGAMRGGAPRAGGYKPRVNTDSPYYDEELLGALEDYVLKRCPAYGFTRELGGSYEKSALHGLILMRDPAEPLPESETKRFKAVNEYAPDHPEVQRRFAMRTIRDGRAAQGLARLETLVQRHPFFASGYEALFKVCAETNTPVPEAALTGNALLACSEDLDLLKALGTAFLETGFCVNAIAAFSLATCLAPKDEQARQALATAMAQAGK